MLVGHNLADLSFAKTAKHVHLGLYDHAIAYLILRLNLELRPLARLANSYHLVVWILFAGFKSSD